MEFFKNVKNSVYGPNFYSGLIAKPLSYSLRYYFIFAFLAALVATIVLSFSVLPQIKTALDDLKTKVFESYPAELVVKIEKGKVSTNAQEPFYIKYSSASNGIENMLAIDIKNTTELNWDKFYGYKSYCLLTETNLVCRDSGNQLRVQSLREVPNMTINKEQIASWGKTAETLFKFIYPLFFLFVIGAFFFAITCRLVYLFFFALLVWLVAKLKKINIGYTKSYQLGLHLMTPAFIVTYFTFLFFPRLDIPYFFTIVALIAALVNLKRVDSLPESAKTETKVP